MLKKVYLVGAGPGSADLITVRGRRLLRQADVVIYDSLIPRSLLEETRSDCVRISVGKRMGRHSVGQSEINRILTESAETYDRVVRLKGGDPFVFGRGGEEALVLKKAGIPFEVVPGVTSATAVPGHAGIPVTHRGVARSFQVITAHTADGVAEDFGRYAGAADTLVFLMGLHALQQISEDLRRAGMDPSVPCAVISSGFSAEEETVRGNLENIAGLVQERELKAPAVIVVGETAGLSCVSKERQCPTVSVVGTDAFYRNLEAAMQGSPVRLRHDFRVKLRPEEESVQRLCRELKQVEKYQWILFASQNAVRMFFEIADRAGFDRRRLSGIRFAAVGRATAAVLKTYGYLCDFVPAVYTTEALAEGLAEQKPDGNILTIRAEGGNPAMEEIFRDRGIDVTKIELYRAEGESLHPEDRMDEPECLVFASASGVRLFLEWKRKFRKERVENAGADTKIMCIGNATANALRREGLEPDWIADPHTAEGIAKVLQKEFCSG